MQIINVSNQDWILSEQNSLCLFLLPKQFPLLTVFLGVLIVLMDRVWQLNEIPKIHKFPVSPFSDQVSNRDLLILLQCGELLLWCFNPIGLLDLLFILHLHRFCELVYLFNVCWWPNNLLQVL